MVNWTVVVVSKWEESISNSTLIKYILYIYQILIHPCPTEDTEWDFYSHLFIPHLFHAGIFYNYAKFSAKKKKMHFLGTERWSFHLPFPYNGRFMDRPRLETNGNWHVKWLKHIQKVKHRCLMLYGIFMLYLQIYP